MNNETATEVVLSNSEPVRRRSNRLEDMFVEHVTLKPEERIPADLQCRDEKVVFVVTGMGFVHIGTNITKIYQGSVVEVPAGVTFSVRNASPVGKLHFCIVSPSKNTKDGGTFMM